MDKWGILHKTLGFIFITIGLVFYMTPVPGTTLLIVLGFVWLIGEKKTLYFLKKILSKKTFKFLKIKRVIEKI